MRSILTGAILLTAVIAADAQWINYVPAGTPLKADGTVNLTAPVPRGANGKPDLTGTWHRGRSLGTTATAQEGAPGAAAAATARNSSSPPVTAGTTGVGSGSYANNILKDFKGEDPELPAAAKVRLARTADGKRMDPTVFCLPMGIPMNNMFPEVVKIVQAPTIMIIMYEVDGTYRQIYLDGRKLPEDPSPAWMGYSTAHWDGDTLVVESAGFNDKSWLDMSGHAHSEDLRVTERFTRHDFGHMDVEMTFVDPKMYSKPISVKFAQALMPDSDILETYCNENEKDRAHLTQ